MLSGCVDDGQRSVIWSTSGERAAVVGQDGLYFIDGDGKVLPPRFGAVGINMAWFDDNRRMAMVYAKPLATWKQIVESMPTEKLTDIREQAEETRARLLSYTGKMEEFQWRTDPSESDDEMEAMRIYLRDEAPGALQEKMGTHWSVLQKIETHMWCLQLFSFRDDHLESGVVLFKSFYRMGEPQISPNGKFISFLQEDSEDDSRKSSLRVISVNGGPAPEVADFVVALPAWSPDSTSLAYICHEKMEQALGILKTIRVASDGKLLDSRTGADERVALLISEPMAVRWRADGKILFSTYETRLPAPLLDWMPEWTIYSFDPQLPSGVSRAVAREASQTIRTKFAQFELSPDGTRVLLQDDDGQWCIYELSSGKTTSLLPPQLLNDNFTELASWKTNDEVSIPLFIKKSGSDEVSREVFLVKDLKVRQISSDWPPAMKLSAAR
jgi:hypothetical protein